MTFSQSRTPPWRNGVREIRVRQPKGRFIRKDSRPDVQLSFISKKPTDNLKTSFFNTTEVYRLIREEWKIIHTHWSYIQHNMPESLEVTIPVLMKDDKPFEGTAAEILRLETRALERWRRGDPSGGLQIAAPEITHFDPDTPSRLNGTIQSRIPWNCTEVYAKTDGGWKVVHSHWSFIKGWRKDSGV